jgi:transcriptional regulator with XRE-family HTH domain
MRAARSLIGWTREQLAEAAGATTRNLARIEAGETKPFPRTLAAIRSALEAAGVEFIAENGGGAGVRLRKGGAPHALRQRPPDCVRLGQRMKTALVRRRRKIEGRRSAADPLADP